MKWEVFEADVLSALTLEWQPTLRIWIRVEDDWEKRGERTFWGLGPKRKVSREWLQSALERFEHEKVAEGQYRMPSPEVFARRGNQQEECWRLTELGLQKKIELVRTGRRALPHILPQLI